MEEALLLFHPLTGVDEVASSKSPPLALLEGEVARLLLEPIETVPVDDINILLDTGLPPLFTNEYSSLKKSFYGDDFHLYAIIYMVILYSEHVTSKTKNVLTFECDNRELLKDNVLL